MVVDLSEFWVNSDETGAPNTHYDTAEQGFTLRLPVNQVLQSDFIDWRKLLVLTQISDFPRN
jgi:hypothetical protein